MSRISSSDPIASTLETVASKDNVYKFKAYPEVVAGQLVTLLENKRVVPFSPAIGLTVENNNTAPPSTAFAKATLIGSAASNEEYIGVCELSNGNFAAIASKAATNQVTCVIRTPVGGVVVAEFNIQAAAGGGNVYTSITALPNGKFVVGYQSGTNPNTIKAAIYNNDGSLAVAAFNIYVNTDGTNMSHQVMGFGNNNWVIIYREGNGVGASRYRIYDSTGAAVTAVQNIATVSNTLARLKKLKNGNVLIFWRESSTFKFMVIDQTGAVVVAATTLTATGSMTGPRYVSESRFAVGELTGGNLVFMTPNNANQQPTIWIRTAAGAAVANFTPSAAYYSDSMTPAIIPNDRGGFALVGLSNSNVYYSTYTAAGVIEQINPINLSSMSVSPNYNGSGTFCQTGGMHIDGYGYLIFAIGYHDGNGLTTMTVGLFSEAIASTSNVIEWRWTQIGGTITQEAGVSGYRIPNLLGKYSQRVFPFFYHGSGGDFTMVTYNTMRSSVFGVANDAYSSVSEIDIAAKGTFFLPASQDVGLKATFDALTNTVPGNKGTFLGRNLVLAGPTV